jgi:hypothetical protein
MPKSNLYVTAPPLYSTDCFVVSANPSSDSKHEGTKDTKDEENL